MKQLDYVEECMVFGQPRKADDPLDLAVCLKVVYNPNVTRVEEELKASLGTKVTINNTGNKGKIEIEYYSKDELERLIELLKTLA